MAKPARFREDSTEYVTVTIKTSDDVSGDTVEVGLTTGRLETPDTWLATEHVTANMFRFLVGPGAGAVVDPGPGSWYVVARFTDTPEVPVIDAGHFTVDAVTA